MPLRFHWFLPTNGDSRTDLSLGNAVGSAGSRVVAGGGTERAPDIGYIGQIARSAEQLGFHGALTPTSSWCEDAWIMTAGLTQVTRNFRFLVALRPGLRDGFTCIIPVNDLTITLRLVLPSGPLERDVTTCVVGGPEDQAGVAGHYCAVENGFTGSREGTPSCFRCAFVVPGSRVPVSPWSRVTCIVLIY